VLRIFIASKKSIALAGFEPVSLVSSGRHANHFTTEATLTELTPRGSVVETLIVSHSGYSLPLVEANGLLLCLQLPVGESLSSSF
jgi:hypothetical protein